MATEFTLPDLGENITSGDVVSVLVKTGDVVEPGQSVLEVETDKAVIEVPCPPGGVIQEVLVKKGETVNVGQALLSLGSPASLPAAAAPPCSRTPVEPETPAPAVKSS
jgi:pyruvate dehydrogenase E2 component (dihydrolipoamide acetyltransferase)